MSVKLLKWDKAQNCEKKYWLSKILPENFPANVLKTKKYEYGNLTYSQALSQIEKTIETYRVIKTEDKVLQIGCGPLDVINLWKGTQRYGLDPLMEFYRSQYKLTGDFLINDIKKKAEDLDEIDMKFDVILALNVLDHTQDIDLILEKLKKKLYKGGILYTITNTWNSFGVFLRKIACPLGIDRAHTYSFRSCDIDALMEKHGFCQLYRYKNQKTLQYQIMKESGVAILQLLATLRIPVFPYVALYTL